MYFDLFKNDLTSRNIIIIFLLFLVQVEDQGVDPNLRDGDGATPLHFAASRGHVDCVRWLLRHGALLLQDNYGKSPINDAAENQQMQVYLQDCRISIFRKWYYSIACNL